MQTLNLLVAAVDGFVGDSATPCLKSETGGTRFWGGVEGCATAMVAVRV
jgi:hypothetical protein